MQAFSVPMAGIYKLEAFGARGGIGNNSGTSSNGLGGYGMGYLILKAGDVVYVCVGGKGANGGGGYGNDVRAAGGYNGGGAGGIHREWFDDGGWRYGKGAGGGGATHFATVSGTIEAIGSGGIGKIL